MPSFPDLRRADQVKDKKGFDLIILVKFEKFNKNIFFAF